MSSKMKSLEDLFEHQLKDLYSAETQLIDALPKMVEKASSSELKEAFKDHLDETKEHKTIVEKVCKELKIDPSGETCKAMKGLISEAKSMMEENATAEVMDAALIAEAQRVEHYEIAGYGTACTYADILGHKSVKEKLGKILDQEEKADKKLTKIAQKVNKKADA